MKKIIGKGLSCNQIENFLTGASINTLNILLFVLILLFAADVGATEDNWVYVSEREDNLWFINTDSITCDGNICKTFVKMQPLAEKYEYTTELNEYNCTEMEYKTVGITKYDSTKNTIRSIAHWAQGWSHVVPESISKELYDFVCKKTHNQKAQLNTNEKDEKHKVETKLTTAENKKELSLSPQKSSETIFTVQAGAFKNPSYAEALIAQLKKKGYTAYTVISKSKEGEKLYKVCIGKFIEREEAKTLTEKIRNSEGIQAFVSSLQP